MLPEANEAPAWLQLETKLTSHRVVSTEFSMLLFFSAAIVPMLLTSVTIQSQIGGFSPLPATSLASSMGKATRTTMLNLNLPSDHSRI